MKNLFALFLSLAFVTKAADTNALPALAPTYGEIAPTFFEQHEMFVIIGSCALLVLATLAIWKMLQPKPAVILPPEVLTRTALTRLLRQPEDGKVSSEVSQILRHYIIAAFELSTAEMTTKEFCAALAANEKIGTEVSNSISNFLRECDERKFSTSATTSPFNAAARTLELVVLIEKRRTQISTAK